MKILIVPDSFKGSLSSLQVINLIAKSATQIFPGVEIIKVPVADGGEGTVEALVTALGGEYHTKEVTGPLGKKVNARWGVVRSTTAVMEMAQTSGITLISKQERDPLLTTTFGVGELLGEILDQGFRDILVGIGGSATNDGGVGALQALGCRFKDSNGKEIGYGGGELERICSILPEGIDSRLKEASITVICDVDNPLTGKHGATYTFGPQKGADDVRLVRLESGMKNYAARAREALEKDIDSIPGAGAAGGLGAALTGFCGATLKSGIDTVLDYVGFDELIKDVAFVVTGEGRIDAQSAHGKVPVGVSRRCKALGVPVLALVGSIGAGAEAVYEQGVSSIESAICSDISIEEAIEKAPEYVSAAADRLFRCVRAGMCVTSK